MSDEDLPAAHHMCQWDTLVFLPVLNRLLRVDEDDEVLVLTLEMDLRRTRVSLHGGCR